MKNDLKQLGYPFIIAAIILAALYFVPLRFTSQQPRSVTVSGIAKTQKMNEVAQFTAGVNAVNDDKQKAVTEVNTKVSELISAVKKFGIDPKDIKTQNMNIYQNQEMFYEEGRQKQMLGQWNVNNTVEIVLRDVKRANELTDLLSQSGANNVYGPSFSLDTETTNDTELMNKAIANAREKATAIAKAGGAKLGKVLTIHEGTSDTMSPLFYDAKGLGGGGGANMETEIGSTTVSKTVTVTFELK